MAATARILVVDDEPLIRDSLAEFLTQEGFAVSACGSGEEAPPPRPQHAFKVAPTRSNVLLVGESGTGKELIARAIHHGMEVGHDSNRDKAKAGLESCPTLRFIAVNCAAIPHDLLENQLFGHRKGAFTGADRDQPGVFVHAGAGTVFLDEIAEAPMGTQAKLPRAIELKETPPVGATEPPAVEARILP